MVNGLRVYILDGAVATVEGFQEFYSRRADGPYYRWWYEYGLKQWRVARVRDRDFPTAPLCSSTWKSLPVGLQGSLVEHYLD